MSNQPEALWLADNADKAGAHAIAAELRRLHMKLAETMNQELVEPCGWVDDNGLVFWREGKQPKDGADLFAHPPRREWRGLTEEDERVFLDSVIGSLPVAKNLIRAIEAKLKELNHE
jgi:hypothetical protein